MKYLFKFLFSFLCALSFSSFAFEEAKGQADQTERIKQARIAQNLRLLGGESILDPDVSRAPKYLMPAVSIALADPAFEAPLVPTNSLTALVFLLFPYPNHFAHNTMATEPWSKLSQRQVDLLLEGCQKLKAEASIEGGCTLYLLSEKIEESLSNAIRYGEDSWTAHDNAVWDSIDDDTLKRFVVWHAMLSFSKRVSNDISSFGTAEILEKLRSEHPADLYQWICSKLFSGAVNWLGMEEETLQALGGSDETLQKHFGHYVFQNSVEDPIITTKAFKRRFKVLLMKQFIKTLSQAVMDDMLVTEPLLSPSDLLRLYRDKRSDATIAAASSDDEDLTKETVGRDSRNFFDAPAHKQLNFLKSFSGVFDPILIGTACIDGVSFSDCVETALLNTMLAAVYTEKDQKLSWPTEGLASSLQRHLQDRPTLESHLSLSSHSAWGELVAALPGVNYVKHTPDGRGCEIKSGVISSINVLSRLLGLPPLDRTMDQEVIKTNLAAIVASLQKINPSVTLELDDDSLSWNHKAHDYVGEVVLKRDEDSSGKLSLTTRHGEFSWTRKTDPIMRKLLTEAKTEEELLMISYAVNTEETFAQYVAKMAELSVPLMKWRHHIFQMDLRTHEMQAAVFGKIYPLPGWQGVSLSIVQRGQMAFSENLLKHMEFLQNTGPQPTDIFLEKLVRVAPELMGNTWDGSKLVSLFSYYVTSGHKDMLMPEILRDVRSIQEPMFDGLAEDDIKAFVSQMRNLRSISFYKGAVHHHSAIVLGVLKAEGRLDKVSFFQGSLNDETLSYFNEMTGLTSARLDFSPSLVLKEDQIIGLSNTYFLHPRSDLEGQRSLHLYIPFDSEAIDRMARAIRLNGGVLETAQSIYPYQVKEFRNE